MSYPGFVAVRHTAHLLGWGLGCIAAPVLLRSAFGRGWGAIGVTIALLATVWLSIMLPRSAHKAFEGARWKQAARRYRILAAFAFSAHRERAAVLSRAGCDIEMKKFATAEAALATIEPTDTTERVVWLNNRACLLLENPEAAAAALALVEEATALRPDVPAIQHTRARALLAVGRTDEAISVFEGMRSGGELPHYLEAERCRDLARAWELKGQTDYAADYRERARLHAS
jgi:pentatricopeptide repeat protein